MLSDEMIRGSLVVLYCCLLLAHLWPYLTQVWTAYRQGKRLREVPRPARNRMLTGSLAFLSGVLWTWLYFKN